jgi:transposase-like protein
VTAAGSSYKGFRFPPEIISHCVWLYHRFPLSFRDVQELMLERGVDVSYETIRPAPSGRSRGRRYWSARQHSTERCPCCAAVWITDDEHGWTCLDTGKLICTHAT